MFCTVCLKSSCLLICFHSWSLDLSQTLIQTIQILKEETTAPKPMEKQKTNKKITPCHLSSFPSDPLHGSKLLFFCFFPPQLCVGFLFLILYPGAPRLLLLPPLLPHTTLSIFHTQLCRSHTQLCHTPTFTHNFVTHYLSHNFVTHHLSHTTFPHTIFQTPLSHTNFVTHIHLHFTWQAWHKLTSTLVLRGRRGTYGIG